MYFIIRHMFNLSHTHSLHHKKTYKISVQIGIITWINNTIKDNVQKYITQILHYKIMIAKTAKPLVLFHLEMSLVSPSQKLWIKEWEISYTATNRKMSDTRPIKRASAQKMYIIERKNHRDSLIGIPSIILPPVSSMLSLIFPRHSS